MFAWILLSYGWNTELYTRKYSCDNLCGCCVDYGLQDSLTQRNDDSEEGSESENEVGADPDVRALHDKLNKERLEREAWIKQHRVSKRWVIGSVYTHTPAGSVALYGHWYLLIRKSYPVDLAPISVHSGFVYLSTALIGLRTLFRCFGTCIVNCLSLSIATRLLLCNLTAFYVRDVPQFSSSSWGYSVLTCTNQWIFYMI